MTRRWLTTSMVMGIAALTAVACGSGDEDSVFGSSGAGGTASSGSAGAGQGGDGGVNLSGSGGSGGAASSGCSKVDFLFIIDNSVSMQDQQTALIGSFPGFIQSIQNTLSAGSDYHIMVTDTDDATRCTPANCQSGAMSANTLCDAPNGYACTTQFEACDNIIGAGVLHPAGDGATNAPCTVLGGNRYMVEGEPDLTASFSCVAQVGLAGHPAERPMDSLVGAMSPALNDAGGCNDGFLRDDAILVVTFISDDPNYEDADGPQEWYDAVVAAKGGKTDSVVVLGLTPAFDGCSSSSKPAKGQHWSDFIAMWGSHGLEASVCNLDYAPFFEQAVSVIDEVCDEFEAPR